MLCDARVKFGCVACSASGVVVDGDRFPGHLTNGTKHICAIRGVPQPLKPSGLVSLQRYRETFVAWRVIVCCVVSLYPLWWWHFVSSVATFLIVVVLLTLLPFQSSVVCLAWSLRLSYQCSIPPPTSIRAPPMSIIRWQ